MRQLAAIAAAAAALALTACGTGGGGTAASSPAANASSPGGSTSSPGGNAGSTGGNASSTGGNANSPATPAGSCRAQFEAWRNGPAKAAAGKLLAQFRTVTAAGEAGALSRMDAALRDAGKATVALQAYPIPHCADPHGYWPAILARFRSAAGDASSGGGLGSLILVLVPLRQVPGLLSSLRAELRQTVGVSTPVR